MKNSKPLFVFSSIFFSCLFLCGALLFVIIYNFPRALQGEKEIIEDFGYNYTLKEEPVRTKLTFEGEMLNPGSYYIPQGTGSKIKLTIKIDEQYIKQDELFRTYDFDADSFGHLNFIYLMKGRDHFVKFDEISQPHNLDPLIRINNFKDLETGIWYKIDPTLGRGKNEILLFLTQHTPLRSLVSDITSTVETNCTVSGFTAKKVYCVDYYLVDEENSIPHTLNHMGQAFHKAIRFQDVYTHYRFGIVGSTLNTIEMEFSAWFVKNSSLKLETNLKALEVPQVENETVLADGEKLILTQTDNPKAYLDPSCESTDIELCSAEFENLLPLIEENKLALYNSGKPSIGVTNNLRAAICAKREGKLKEFLTSYYANSFYESHNPFINNLPTSQYEWAMENGVDMEEFENCFNSGVFYKFLPTREELEIPKTNKIYDSGPSIWWVN